MASGKLLLLLLFHLKTGEEMLLVFTKCFQMEEQGHWEMSRAWAAGLCGRPGHGGGGGTMQTWAGPQVAGGRHEGGKPVAQSLSLVFLCWWKHGGQGHILWNDAEDGVGSLKNTHRSDRQWESW